jgi:hypothetical protein
MLPKARKNRERLPILVLCNSEALKLEYCKVVMNYDNDTMLWRNTKLPVKVFSSLQRHNCGVWYACSKGAKENRRLRSNAAMGWYIPQMTGPNDTVME